MLDEIIITSVVVHIVLTSGVYLLLAYMVVPYDMNCALFRYGTVTRYLYLTTKMNWVGCVIVAVFYYLIFPIFIIAKLCCVVYWLFHVGRF